MLRKCQAKTLRSGYLFETKEVTVYGQMTEIGAEVARVEVK